MKERIKKLISILALTGMTVSMLAGCRNAETQNESKAESKQESKQEQQVEKTEEAKESEEVVEAEPKTFTMFAGQMSLEMDYNENPAFMWACDNTNVYFDITHCVAGDTKEQGNLLLSSGDYPDVIFKAWIDRNKFGQEGILIPLEDLIREHAPNLCARLDADNGWAYIKASDGHVYTLPEIQGKSAYEYIPWINTVWLDKLGLDMPTDMDSLYEVLKAFKEKDPNGNGQADEIPLGVSTQPAITALLQFYGYNYNGYWALDENKDIFFMPDTDGWKEFLAYCTKLYSEGLVNQDCFTFDWSGLQPKASAGEDNIMGMIFDFGVNPYIGSKGDIDEYGVVTPFFENTTPATAGYMLTGNLCITDKCEDPAAVIAWADQFYSEEGAIVATMGLEDVAWKWNEDGTWSWIIDSSDPVAYYNNFIQGHVYHPSAYPDNEFKNKRQNIPRRTSEKNRFMDYLAEAWPPLIYTEEEKQELSVIETDIKGQVWEYLAAVMVGDKDLENTWDEYLQILDDMGLERLKEIKKAVYDRAVAAQ